MHTICSCWLSTKPCRLRWVLSPATSKPTCKRLQLRLANSKRITEELVVARPTRTTTTLHSTTRRTGVQRDRSQAIVSVRHHRQAAHPNSSSKVHAILLTKTIMHVKLLAYVLNSVWLHFVMVHSSSKFPYSSYLSSSSPCT